MGNKIKFSFCNYCEKEVDPSKKPLDSMAKTIWIVICISTLGFGLIAYLFYTKLFRKKLYCSTCESKLVFSDKPFDQPKALEDMTAKEKIVAKTGKKVPAKRAPKKKTEKEREEIEEVKEEAEESKIYCPFCGEQLKEKVDACPFCKAEINLQNRD